MQRFPQSQPSDAAATGSAPTGTEALAIAIGGALGASLRFAISLGIQAADQHGAWATAMANLLGAFLLGVVVARLDSPIAHPLLRPFLVVGVFSSFTTFSALAFDNQLLATQHGEAIALVHLVGSIVTGMLAFAWGAAISRGRPRRRQ